MSWSWSDAYPGLRPVTILLPEQEADELVSRAIEDGRLLAPGVVMTAKGGEIAAQGPQPPLPAPLRPMPAITMPVQPVAAPVASKPSGAPPAPALPPKPRPMAPKQPTRPAQPAGAAVETKSPTRPPEPSPAPVKREAQPAKPVSVHIHNSAVLELPSQPAGSNANPDRKPARQIEPNMRAMIDAAVKAGNITKCPPRTFAFDAAEPGQSWRKTGARKSGSKPRKGLLTSDRKPIEEDGE